jgi:hypothetical protein
MRKRKFVFGLAVAALLSLGIAGAAYAASGPQVQGQHRGGPGVSTTVVGNTTGSTNAPTSGDQLQTRARLQDGSCDRCVTGGTQAAAAQTATTVKPGAGNGYGASSSAGNLTQTQSRLRDGSSATCDGTCDGTGPGTAAGSGAGNGTRDRTQLCDGSCGR